MAHFAKLGINNKVIAVHVLDNAKLLNADGVEDEAVGQQELEKIHGWPSDLWIKTSYNTFAGQHPEGKPLRKNFAGIGFSYDINLDAFIPPKPFNSWVLDETNCQWKAPVDMPTDGKFYNWNEEKVNWEEIIN